MRQRTSAVGRSRRPEFPTHFGGAPGTNGRGAEPCSIGARKPSLSSSRACPVRQICVLKRRFEPRVAGPTAQSDHVTGHFRRIRPVRPKTPNASASAQNALRNDRRWPPSSLSPSVEADQKLAPGTMADAHGCLSVREHRARRATNQSTLVDAPPPRDATNVGPSFEPAHTVTRVLSRFTRTGRESARRSKAE
jgi:hypothetical protein